MFTRKFQGLQHVLSVESQRLEDEEDLALTLRLNTMMESYLFMLKILVMIACLKMCALQYTIEQVRQR